MDFPLRGVSKSERAGNALQTGQGPSRCTNYSSSLKASYCSVTECNHSSYGLDIDPYELTMILSIKTRCYSTIGMININQVSFLTYCLSFFIAFCYLWSNAIIDNMPTCSYECEARVRKCRSRCRCFLRTTRSRSLPAGAPVRGTFLSQSYKQL